MKRCLSCLLLLPLLTFLVGCASYNARSLNRLSPPIVSSGQSHVMLCAKAFNRGDCMRYLDRNVLKAGFQPVQIDIDNHTDRTYHLATSRISLPCVDVEEVARRVHTSTVGRATAYSVAAFLTVGLFFIPAVVDGVCSYQANEALDYDYGLKAMREQVILPHSHASLLIFVPKESYSPDFFVTLVDEFSHQPEQFLLTAA